MDKTALVEVRDGVATVTLNNAASGNILDMAMGRDLLEAALRVDADPAVRAVVLTGAGKHFCFGGDLQGMARQGEAVGGYLVELTTNIHAAISCFTRMRAPGARRQPESSGPRARGRRSASRGSGRTPRSARQYQARTA